MPRLTTVVAALAFAAVASVAWAQGPALTLKKTNAVVKYTVVVNGQTQTVTVDASKGDVAIPAGAEVSVVSGNATFATATGMTITAGANESFAVTSNASGAPVVAAKSGTVEVKVNGATAAVGAGSSIAVAPASGNAAPVISVVSGTASVTDSSGNTQTVTTGGTATVTTTTVAAPAEAPGAPAIVIVTVTVNNPAQDQQATCTVVSPSSPGC